MLFFGDTFGRATQLFHSADITELMEDFRLGEGGPGPLEGGTLDAGALGSGDISAMLADAGLDPADLGALPADALVARLGEAGIDTASVNLEALAAHLRRS